MNSNEVVFINRDKKKKKRACHDVYEQLLIQMQFMWKPEGEGGMQIIKVMAET